MQLPPELLESLEGLPGFDRAAFESIHVSGQQITSIRLNPAKVVSPRDIGFSDAQQIPWAKDGYYLPARPSFTFDPHFHAGCYYVQEASSMFLEQVFLQTQGTGPMRVLDLCAAPGGKSTHLLSLISRESLLVSNELIRSRVNVLSDNIIKWGHANVIVTNNDACDFARLPGYFDVIVVDAPCSGSGLFRRDPEAIDEWSENNVALCCQRQQRILADVLPSLKENGILIYSTCSYSKEEDEDVMEWMTKELKLGKIPLHPPAEWMIVETNGALRFYPDKVRGEGFFIAAFRKLHSVDHSKYKNKRLETVNTSERKLLGSWITTEEFFFKSGQTICAVPPSLEEDAGLVANNLKVVQAGLQVGEAIRDKFIPHHMLAMSSKISSKIPAGELDLENAIRFLQRKEITVGGVPKGWNLVRFRGHNLGWINVLQNRINNYYPKEMRILKQ